LRAGAGEIFEPDAWIRQADLPYSAQPRHRAQWPIVSGRSAQKFHPTFTGFGQFRGQDRAVDRLGQRKIALLASRR